MPIITGVDPKLDAVRLAKTMRDIGWYFEPYISDVDLCQRLIDALVSKGLLYVKEEK